MPSNGEVKMKNVIEKPISSPHGVPSHYITQLFYGKKKRKRPDGPAMTFQVTEA
jgi:hypothetical protein